MGIAITVKLLDTSTEAGRSAKNVLELVFNERQILVSELIKRRVREEVVSYNEGSRERHNLVDLSDQELAVNGPRAKEQVSIDVEKAIERALLQFEQFAYVVIADGTQVSGLDDSIELSDQMEVEFFRLIMLVGG
jgi:hypothetical protein